MKNCKYGVVHRWEVLCSGQEAMLIDWQDQVSAVSITTDTLVCKTAKAWKA